MPYALRHSVRPWREFKSESGEVEGRTARIGSLLDLKELHRRANGAAVRLARNQATACRLDL